MSKGAIKNAAVAVAVGVVAMLIYDAIKAQQSGNSVSRPSRPLVNGYANSPTSSIWDTDGRFDLSLGIANI